MGLMSSVSDWLKNKVVGWLEGEFSSTYSARAKNLLERRGYRYGVQQRFLKPTREGFDDNIVANFLGLALDRAISLLFGKEVEFEWGEDASDEAVEYIHGIWEANNKPILLHKLAMYGGEAGTVFVKLVPDEERVWRIVAQDPIFKDILTDPDDDEKIIRYTTQYKTTDLDGNEVAKREWITIGNYVTTETTDMQGNATLGIQQGDPDVIPPNWLIQNFILSRDTGGKWKLESQEIWPYALPPIIHWQNLPMVGSTWGMPDIPDDVIEMQDKSNFALSNNNRILRLFAHPFRWSRFFGGSRNTGRNEGETDLDVGPNKMPNASNEKAEIFQLPPVGDLPGATGHAQNLRQIIFDITRNSDIASMKDKVGALTNFGLRILFFDALNKLDTKRNLYGWGLREINRRLFIFSGAEPVECKVIWEDPLPVDETALRQNAQTDLSMGIVSRETISKRLGYNWDDEKKLLAAQQTESDNVGAMLLRAFDRTGGNEESFGQMPSERTRMPMGGSANNGPGNQRRNMAR